ncbi:D-ribose pyranase [Alicyclobacillus vulcanalis]|uniref:D-ribose pyranase n=1 Tax=Alicyclobacillus vulcanalis TaxID=252246 RepID=A0A1N7P549_9BACL|nr:D-ribose pyranase [Alicyclobacillus vulcanalis]SIT05742.1 D-ribose pyranase [Alicyclobacillus vulcanalis]
MKRYGIMHGRLSQIIAQLGHGELVAVADCGLPIPPGVEIVDLALKPGTPSFLEVCDTILTELVVEDFVVANELASRAPEVVNHLRERVGTLGQFVSHSDFKQALPNVRSVVRTGEWTPYKNVIFVAGVAFS